MCQSDLMNLFNELDDSVLEKVTREAAVRAPFNYPGAKTRSIVEIINRLPYRKSYIEPFGGTGTILLNRNPSTIEVLNDKYFGIVAFYRCIRDSAKSMALVNRLKDILHSREEFIWCKDTWANCEDDVERAARWYYMIMFSFASLGRNFGRSTSSDMNMADILAKRILGFDKIHNRLKSVLIENQDYANLLYDFDSEDAVFYLDPPYYEAYKNTYKFEMTPDEHKKMLNTIFKMKAFVAVSSYYNELYDQYPWTTVYRWTAQVSIKAMAFHEENYKEDELSQRQNAEECLFIKE
jgi:DNA adenine methylase